jgi:hypothetical protein
MAGDPESRAGELNAMHQDGGRYKWQHADSAV